MAICVNDISYEPKLRYACKEIDDIDGHLAEKDILEWPQK